MLSQWLETAGFKWNPFSEMDAKDEPHLGEYFIYPVGFEEMLGKNSAALYAPRGGGKTASRRMVEHFCAIGEVPGKIFSVTYDNFGRVVERAEKGLDSVTARMHVEAILRKAVPPLFNHLVQNPELVTGFEVTAYLKQFVQSFTDCLAYYRLNQLLQGTGVTKKDIVDAIARGNLVELLEVVVEDYHPRIRFIATLLEQELSLVSLDDLTATELLARFSDLLVTGSAGFGALFILVDNVDGLPQTDGNPQACVKLLSHLIGTASLMSLPGVFFKFFLPLDTKPLLERIRAFQIRQVRSVEIEWSDDKLLAVLQARLSAATQEGKALITSLDAVSEERLRGRIDRELTKYSETPRDVLLLGQEAFRAHIRQSPDKDYITVEDFDLALKPVRDRERLQRRQESWRRGLRWGGGLLAAVFAFISLLTWLLFLLPLHTSTIHVPHTSLFIFARYPRYLPMGGKGEISVTVNNDGAADIADIRTGLIFTPTCPIEFPKGNVAEFGLLVGGMGSTRGISFIPLEAHLVHFDLTVLAEGSIREVVEGGTVRVVRVPNALVKYFFVQPLLFVASAIGAGLSKQISEFVLKMVGRVGGSQSATDEDRKGEATSGDYP